MTADAIRAALVDRFRDNWNAEAPAGLQLARIEMPNHKADRGTSQPWARLTVALGDRNNAAVGGTKIRQNGILYLQVFLPDDSGTTIGTQAFDALAAIFDNQTVAALDATGYVHCSAATSYGTGERDGYEQFNFGVPFYADDDR